jgi:hypothetical protein
MIWEARSASEGRSGVHECWAAGGCLRRWLGPVIPGNGTSRKAFPRWRVGLPTPYRTCLARSLKNHGLGSA